LSKAAENITSHLGLNTYLYVGDVIILRSGAETEEGRGGNGFRQRLTSLSKQTKVIASPSLRLVARTAGKNLTKIA
jgi:hypothetical protein